MLVTPGFKLTTSRTVVRHLNQLSQPVGGEKKKEKPHEHGSNIRKNQSTLRFGNEVNISEDIVLKSQWSLDGSRS